MPTIIDPTQALNDEQLQQINDLLKDEDKKETRKKLQRGFFNKESPREGKEKPNKGQEVKLAHSIMKIGDRYYVINRDAIGKGSEDIKVKLMPTYFVKNAEGNYVQHIDGAVKEGVCIKVYGKKNLSGKPINKVVKDDAWKEMKAKFEHEFMVLHALGDSQAELFIDETNRKIYLKQTLAKGESLEDFLRKNEGMPLSERLLLAQKIITLMKNLHDEGFAHLDFHMANIMIDEKTGNLTLIDFGSAEVLTATLKDNPLEKQKTNFCYRPFNYTSNTPSQVDLYSLAGVLGQLFSFNQSETDVLSNKITLGAVPLFSRDKNKTTDANTYFKERAYNFDCLLSEINLKNLNATECDKLKKIVATLKRLGAEELSTRETMSLEQLADPFEMTSLSSSPVRKVAPTELTAPTITVTPNVVPKDKPAQQIAVPSKTGVVKTDEKEMTLEEKEIAVAVRTALNTITPKQRNILKKEIKEFVSELNKIQTKDEKIKEFISALENIMRGEAAVDAKKNPLSATLLQLLKHIRGHIETMSFDEVKSEKKHSLNFLSKRTPPVAPIKKEDILSVFEKNLHETILKELGLKPTKKQAGPSML